MKRSLLALVPIFVIGLGLRLGFVWNGTLDPDESQHLHAAWLVAHGRILYVDFWEHHGPLFYYLVAPLTRLFTDSPGVYFATRGLMLLAAAAALGLLYLVLRRLEPPVGTAGDRPSLSSAGADRVHDPDPPRRAGSLHVGGGAPRADQVA